MTCGYTSNARCFDRLRPKLLAHHECCVPCHLSRQSIGVPLVSETTVYDISNSVIIVSKFSTIYSLSDTDVFLCKVIHNAK